MVILQPSAGHALETLSLAVPPDGPVSTAASSPLHAPVIKATTSKSCHGAELRIAVLPQILYMTAQQAYASAKGHAGSDRLVVHTLAPGVVFWRRKDGTIPVFAPGASWRCSLPAGIGRCAAHERVVGRCKPSPMILSRLRVDHSVLQNPTDMV